MKLTQVCKCAFLGAFVNLVVLEITLIETTLTTLRLILKR